MVKKSAQALDAGGRDVTVVTTMNLGRLQVHGKWEMSEMRTAMLAETEDDKRWAESTFKSSQEFMTRERP